MIDAIHFTEIRDYLFTAAFDHATHKESAFRCLAVLPSRTDGAAPCIHFAYAKPVWDRASVPHEPEKLIRRMLSERGLHEEQFATQYHEYLGGRWPLPWTLTATDSVNAMPTLVLCEKADGSVTGVLMRETHSRGSSAARLANDAPEYADALGWIEAYRGKTKGHIFYGWWKDADIDAGSLQEAIATTPTTDAGQKAVVLYRGHEWLSGHWNADSPVSFGEAGEHALSSVAEFHGTRVSKATLEQRETLEVARHGTQIVGEWELLHRAMSSLAPGARYATSELHPAVRLVCAWWNTKAAEGSQCAGSFRLYVWQDSNRGFLPCDCDEPMMTAKTLSDNPSYALFEEAGMPTVAAIFFRGAKHHVGQPDGSTMVHYANGDAAMEIGLDKSQVDDAFYSVLGLERLRVVLATDSR